MERSRTRRGIGRSSTRWTVSAISRTSASSRSRSRRRRAMYMPTTVTATSAMIVTSNGTVPIRPAYPADSTARTKARSPANRVRRTLPYPQASVGPRMSTGSRPMIGPNTT